MEELIQAINSVGFPIVAAGGALYSVYYMFNAYRQDSKEQLSTYKELIKQNTEAVNELKAAVQILAERLGGGSSNG